ncbi:MAG: hypothetical protein K9H58_19945, partial [Bacteroidales bacterium]|nr:hypothetical protein [Bacteroidales bacterium]
PRVASTRGYSNLSPPGTEESKISEVVIAKINTSLILINNIKGKSVIKKKRKREGVLSKQAPPPGTRRVKRGVIPFKPLLFSLSSRKIIFGVLS